MLPPHTIGPTRTPPPTSVTVTWPGGLLPGTRALAAVHTSWLSEAGSSSLALTGKVMVTCPVLEVAVSGAGNFGTTLDSPRIRSAWFGPCTSRSIAACGSNGSRAGRVAGCSPSGP
ncbi:hypothetical protein O1L55_26920 [Streptomyces albulus]|nr:hypothetical protein [Streptomyces noursei]